MGPMSHHLMPLVINSLGGGHTHVSMHTHTHTQTQTYTDTDDPHRINFKVAIKWLLAPHKRSHTINDVIIIHFNAHHT